MEEHFILDNLDLIRAYFSSAWDDALRADYENQIRLRLKKHDFAVQLALYQRTHQPFKVSDGAARVAEMLVERLQRRETDFVDPFHKLTPEGQRDLLEKLRAVLKKASNE